MNDVFKKQKRHNSNIRLLNKLREFLVEHPTINFTAALSFLDLIPKKDNPLYKEESYDTLERVLSSTKRTAKKEEE